MSRRMHYSSEAEVLYNPEHAMGPQPGGPNPFMVHDANRNQDPRIMMPKPTFLHTDAHGLSLDTSYGSHNGSSTSVASIPAAPQTPVSQIPTQPGLTLHRFGSVSSIATTDDEDYGEPLFGWTEEQDQFLRTTLDLYTADPTNAPFSGPFPPSGVVHRVSAMTLKRARQQNFSFPHRLAAVRKRILLLCSRDEEEQMSDSSLPSGHMMPTTQGAIPDPHAMETDEFDFEDSYSDHRAPGQRLSELSRAGYAGRSRPGIVPVGIDTSSDHFSPAWNHEAIPLASPFKETFGRQPRVPQKPDGSVDDETDDIVNIVAKRKRDSLKMKRGLR